MTCTVEYVPDPQGQIATELFEACSQTIASEHLSFGGGTVLAARWKHRESLDVDLFCRPDAYAQLTPEQRDRIEKAIKAIPGCTQEATWCDDLNTYTEIDGIEATVLPRPIAIAPKQPTTLATTDLALHSSAQILYAKIVWRMFEGDEITVRDTYDVACARRKDPKALKIALGHIDKGIIEVVTAVIADLPKGWSGHDEKNLINAQYTWTEDELTNELMATLDIDTSNPTITRHGPER